MSTAFEVGTKLVELCKEHKEMEAMETLYSPHIVSIEAMSMPSLPARQEGIAAIRGKAEWWFANHEIHGSTVEGPWPNGDRFIVRFSYDITPKTGPMSGKRLTMQEAALYTVKDGKIVQEEFFYNM